MTSEPRENRKRSRWSQNKAFVPGMPTILPSDLDETKQKIYLLNMDIEETTRKLRSNDFSSSTFERSPSPEPIYDQTGKRLNTREYRKRQELTQRRHEKIQQMKLLNPDYAPPSDYRPPNARLFEKVWIPQDERPEINFVGLLIGPRGNTLKQLEQETGTKIIVRGKGSIKEGKLFKKDGPLPGENEPLHAFITGNDSDAIQKAVEKVQGILDDAVIRPEANMALRQYQFRELALLNGTMINNGSFNRCSNCGSDQHKTFECLEQLNVTANIFCSNCGSGGHLGRDCMAPKTGYSSTTNEELDHEYSALMAEIGSVTGTAKKEGAPEPFKLPPIQSQMTPFTRLPLRDCHFPFEIRPVPLRDVQFQSRIRSVTSFVPHQHDSSYFAQPSWPVSATTFEAVSFANRQNWIADTASWIPPPPPPPEA